MINPWQLNPVGSLPAYRPRVAHLRASRLAALVRAVCRGAARIRAVFTIPHF
jgi:hypothetical protein